MPDVRTVEADSIAEGGKFNTAQSQKEENLKK